LKHALKQLQARSRIARSPGTTGNIEKKAFKQVDSYNYCF